MFGIADVSPSNCVCSHSNPSSTFLSAISVVNSLIHEDWDVSGILAVSVRAQSEVNRCFFSSPMENHRLDCLFDCCKTTC